MHDYLVFFALFVALFDGAEKRQPILISMNSHMNLTNMVFSVLNSFMIIYHYVFIVTINACVYNSIY